MLFVYLSSGICFKKHNISKVIIIIIIIIIIIKLRSAGVYWYFKKTHV